MKKVLHITNWYPNEWNDLEALFIKEQFDRFSQVTASKLLHVQVREGSSWFRYKKIEYAERETGYYILTRIKTFRVIEILSTLLLFWALFQNRVKTYDLLHFHIAYPLLTYHHLWKKFIKVPVLVSEHWSAYHFNFFMPRETTKLDRMKNIFHHGLPVITVSEALMEDIRTFAGTRDFPAYVIPNVIDLDVYRYQPGKRESTKPVFFIVNFWRSIKNPFPMLKGFTGLAKQGMDFELRIGGYGPILDEMQAFVSQEGLTDHTVFLGKMYKEGIAEEMNRADAYLFASEYETFSVVCAQALCCGCPLIGPSIPAIMEYAGSDEMVVLETNDSQGWQSAIENFIARKELFDHHAIAQKAENFLLHEKVKENYREIIHTYVK